MLRLLKRYGVPRKDLLTVLTGYIRPLTEYAAPVWSGALTNNQKSRIERIQKRALRIVFGASYTTGIVTVFTSIFRRSSPFTL